MNRPINFSKDNLAVQWQPDKEEFKGIRSMAGSRKEGKKHYKRDY